MDSIIAFKIPTCAADFPAGESKITHKNEKGQLFVYVLLSEDSVALIKEGTGEHVESATLIAGGDQKKYFSALMAGCIEIDGKGIVMEDLAKIPMKHYMRIQIAFSEINF